MNNTSNYIKSFSTVALLLVSFGCKTVSFSSHSDYGVDKNDEFFSIGVLPDTQYYTAERYGGTMQMFKDQIEWIRKNKNNEKIAYVVHLGDVTDRNTDVEWIKAKTEMYKLETDKIPYGVAVGNHDEYPNETFKQGDPNTLFNKYFGSEHFRDKPWYGGQLERNGNNDNHFDVFTAGGDKYLVMYFAYNEENRLIKKRDLVYEKRVFNWDDSVLNKYSGHKAIMVTHSMLNRTKTTQSQLRSGTDRESMYPEFTRQGKSIYEMAKHHPNVFLMLGGHISGEGFRRDEFNGHVIKTYLADYQGRRIAPFLSDDDRRGGNGLMRLMRFNKTKNTLSVITFAPKADGHILKEEDGDSQFTESLYK